MMAGRRTNPFASMFERAGKPMESYLCEGRNHPWEGEGANDGFDVDATRDGRVRSVVERVRCPRCGATREREMAVDRDGYMVGTVKRRYTRVYKTPKRTQEEADLPRWTRANATWALLAHRYPDLKW